MEEKDNYISLQEATKYCNYTQEYLGLRARQGKLRAVKFARNWVTKKEWLEEYLKEMPNGKCQIPNGECEKPAPKFTEVRPLRTGFLAALVFVLLSASIVFGKENLKNAFGDFDSFATKLSEGTDEVFSALGNGIKNYALNLKEGTGIAFEGTEIVVENLNNTFSTIKNIVSKTAGKIKQIPQIVSQGWQAGTQPFVKGYQFITQPWRVLPEEIVKEKVVQEKIPKEWTRSDLVQIEELRAEIQKLKEQGLPVKEIIKEVTKITKIEPVKEITKEKITEIIPSEELTQIKTQLSQFSLWGTDIENLRNIAKKLQANPVNTNVPTAPIYIGSQGIQVGGSGIFSSLGVSGSAGISNLGVGGSATIGSTASDKLTVAGTSEFNAPVTAKAGLTVGTGTLTIGFIRQPLNYWGNLN